MRLLIDTHVFLWSDTEPDRISPPLLIAIGDSANQIFVSAASVWEIAIKRARGKLEFARPIVEAIRTIGFELLPITGAHAEHAVGLPRHHADPFDRLMLAQAMLEGMTLGTQDPRMRDYGVALLGLG